MTWRDNLRAASSEDGFIIAGGSGASMIPQNTNWHDNYMNSFTEDGIKIANLKDAVSQVETLPQEADTGSLYYLTTGANPGMYYYDGTQWVAVGGGGVTPEELDSRVKQMAGVPTTSTEGVVGQLIEDTVNGELYQCTGIISSIGVDSDAGLTSQITNITFSITNSTTLNSKISTVSSLVGGTTYMVRVGAGNSFYVSAADNTTNLGTLTGVIAYQLPITLGVTPTPPTAWTQQIGRLVNTQPVFSFKTVSSGSSYVWEKVGISNFNNLENRPQLNGVEMDGSTNITNFTGTDGTNTGAQGLVPAPAVADADKFLKSDGTWATAGGGGGVRVLTDADYNYPEGSPSRIALWLLPDGTYYIDNTQYIASPNTDQYRLSTSASIIEIVTTTGSSPVMKYMFVKSTNSSQGSDGSNTLRIYHTTAEWGQSYGSEAVALHSELADVGLSFLYPWSSSDWPENSPDGIAVFKRAGQFDLRYKTKLYLTDTYAVDNFIGRIEINQFENDNNVSVFGFKATDLNHGTIYLGQTQGDGTSEFLYTVSTTTVQTNSSNSSSLSAEQESEPSPETPSEDNGGEPGPEIPPEDNGGEEPVEEPAPDDMEAPAEG